MLIGARTGAWIGGKRLPYDAEVEYIESTGTQRIETGVLGGELFALEIRVYDVATTSYNAFLANKTTNDLIIGSNNGAPAKSYLRIRSNLIWANAVGVDKTFVVRDGVVTANGTQVGTYDQTKSLAAANDGVAIFARSNGSQESVCRVYYAKLYGDGGALLRDLIPVRKGSVGYLYDRVHNRLFGNEGTGNFVVGPDKAAWTNPYVTDGLVAMWDGEWNAGGGVHDASATVIKDLVGNNDLAISAQGKELVSADSFSTSIGNNSWDSTKPDEIASLVRGGSFTIEFVGRVSDYGNSKNWFYFDDNTRAYSMDSRAIYWVRFGASLTNFSGYSPPIDGSSFHIAFRLGGESNSAFVNGEKVCAISKLSGAIPGSFSVLKSAYGFWCKTFRISTALTDAQIAANYAVDKQRFGLP